MQTTFPSMAGLPAGLVCGKAQQSVFLPKPEITSALAVMKMPQWHYPLST